MTFGIGEELGGQPTDEVLAGRLAEALQLIEDVEVQRRSQRSNRIGGTVDVFRIGGNPRTLTVSWASGSTISAIDSSLKGMAITSSIPAWCTVACRRR